MSEVNLKNKKVMLNTKDMSAGSGRPKPVMGPGNHKIKINSITFDKTPYDSESFNIMLHVETELITGDFEGFYKDMNDQSLGRYEGQVGRIRIGPYPFKDATLPSGREISRDQEVLKSMINLGEVLNMRDELDSIQAETIEDFMTECNTLFTEGEKGSKFINVCAASREWENKEGYINDDLYLPRMSKDGIPMEALDTENSRLLSFDRTIHVRALVKKDENQTEMTFKGKTGTGSDFEL